MREHDRHIATGRRDPAPPRDPAAPVPFRPPRRPPPPPGSPRPRHRVRWLRVLLILAGLSLLALVSTVFGMMMAVAADLPDLENRAEFRAAKNSRILDVRGEELGILTGRENRIIVTPEQVAATMKHAVIAVEDRRFYSNPGVDVRAIGRAFVEDVANRRAVQGGSTIAQQFVKNALAAQEERTVFQKLREAALAYHLTRKWSKPKILGEYLNTIYFGNGAYGVESAARTYFKAEHDRAGDPCGGEGLRPCASVLRPWEAALLAGMVASPGAYDPVSRPLAALRRRNLVLNKMLDEGYLTLGDHRAARQQPLPGREAIRPPREISKAPYFTTWVKQQVVDRVGAGRAFGGGLRIRTTLDLELQRVAQQVIGNRLAGPSAALVAIDNKTGEVRAMVGGRDDQFTKRPFNLATQGQRQPGSAFKPFVLAAALQDGIGPGSLWSSHKKVFTVPNSGGKERFVVNNYENAYSGTTTLARATTFSDNSVYAEVGIKVGVRKIARLAERMGIRTPVSRNYAITLGGLREGVTPLDLAHAYQTFARGGQRIYGTLAAPEEGPVGIREIRGPNDNRIARNKERKRRVLPEGVALTTRAILRSVVENGTGTAADLGEEFAAGKTGTTENYGDAWFVGFTDRLTVAVWVGYPDQLKSMRTEYRGEPVAGGTYPAEIWRDFMLAAGKVYDARAAAAEAAKEAKDGKDDDEDGTTGTTPAPVPTTPIPATPEPAQDGEEGAERDRSRGKRESTRRPPRRPPSQPTPEPDPDPAPEGGTPVPSQGGGAAPPP